MKIAIGVLCSLILGMGLSACSSASPDAYGSVQRQLPTSGYKNGYQKPASYYDSSAGHADGNPNGSN